MGPRREMRALIVALVVIVISALFFFYVQHFQATDTLRVEEPYVRTEDQPPSAVEDETSHPDLAE